MRMCPRDSWVTGFRIRNEGGQGRGDDTSWNGLQIQCRRADWSNAGVVTVYGGRWGRWTGWYGNERAIGLAASGLGEGYFISGGRVRWENHRSGDFDDTAANGLWVRATNDGFSGYGYH